MEVSSDDAKKAELEALVNAGKLSQEEAIAIAEKLGLMSAPAIERTSSLSRTTQLYNFSVYKWSKGRTVQRLILQFDFQSSTLSSIQHGTRTKKIDFSSVVSYQSEDGLRLLIKFSNQPEPEYELDADTQEDKNKMCRILEAITRNYKHQTEQDPYQRGLADILTGYEKDSDEVTTSVAESSSVFYTPIDTAERESPSDYLQPIEPAILPPSVSNVPIKEGMVEKRGHSVRILTFARRWMRVFEGELLYYKPDDLENALNIIPLNPSVTDIVTQGNRSIIVSLVGSDRRFEFKTFAQGSKSAEQLRDEWIKAIQTAMFNQSSLTEGMKRRTLTAKDMAPPRRHTIKKSFRKQLTVEQQSPAESYVDPFEASMDVPPQGDLSPVPNNRHWSIPSSIKKRFSFAGKKSESFNVPLREDGGASPRRRDRSITTSTFYYNDEHMAVTKNVSEPADFNPLQLTGKNMNELLVLLKPEFEDMCKVLEKMTTGSSKLDMMVMRVSSIINALQNNYTDVTGEDLSERLSEEELSKRLSTVTESGEMAGSGGGSRVTSAGSSNRGSKVFSPGSSNRDSRVLTPGSSNRESRVLSPGSSNRNSRVLTPGSSNRESRVTSPEGSNRESRVLSPGSSNRESRVESDAGVLDGATSPRATDLLSPLQSDDSESVKLSGLTSPANEDTPDTDPPQNTDPLSPAVVPPPPPLPGGPGMPPPPPPLPGMPGMPPPPPPLPGMPGMPPPPPPLPGMPGMPPPPPPFPGMPGMPPPPPGLPGVPGLGMPSSILPQRNLVKPNTKMRRFYWSSLAPQQVMKCGWMDWAANDYTDSLDLKSLEELFGIQDKPQPEAPVKKKVEKESLLDNNRSRNIEIFLPRFPLALDDLESKLSEQLNNVNDSLELGSDQIVALKRYQPTDEDKEMYKNYKGDKSLLQPADTFLIKLGNIPMLSTRLDLLFTIKEFPANLEGFLPTLELAWCATQELKKSDSFVEVLQYILAIGNYLNFGTRQGAAYGYKLSVLPKLSESSGQDKKTTLMHYLITQLHKNKPELLEIPQELQAVSRASDISITGISAELEVMQKELDKVERFANKIVQQSKLPTASADKLLKDVKEFAVTYRDKLQDLNVKGTEMIDNYRDILIKFGEPLSTDSEDFFADIAKFLTNFKRIHAELFPPPKVLTPRPERKPATQTPTIVETTDSAPKAKQSESEKEVKTAKPSLTASNSASTLSPTPQATPIKDLGIARRGGFGASRKVQPKEGVLEKQTRDGRKWQKRHCELERGQLHLHYAEGKGQKKKFADTIVVKDIPIEIDPNDPKVLVVKAESRVFKFRAESPENAASWFSALKSHSACHF